MLDSDKRGGVVAVHDSAGKLVDCNGISMALNLRLIQVLKYAILTSCSHSVMMVKIDKYILKC